MERRKRTSMSAGTVSERAEMVDWKVAVFRAWDSARATSSVW